jgi:hypothetical protein
MYDSCTNWEHVRPLLEGYATAGSFRRYFSAANGLGRNWGPWFYSGAFYWFRNRDAFARNWEYVPNAYHGPEAWPGFLFKPEEAGVLLRDSVDDLYMRDYWNRDVGPQVESWRSRNLGPRPLLATQPKLSVIVATTGRESLRATLASIRQQRLQAGDEVILAHDGPTLNAATAAAWHEEIFSGGHSGASMGGHVRTLPSGPHGDWGAAARTAGQDHASGTHLLWQDDDDVYLPGAFDSVRREIAQTPDDILLFRVAYPDDRLVWRTPTVQCGNVSTQMFCIPREAKLGTWGTRYEGDFDFLESTIAANPDRRVRFVGTPLTLYGRNLP